MNQYNIFIYIYRFFFLTFTDVKATSGTIICWWFGSRVIHCRVRAWVDQASCLGVWSSIFDGLFQGPIHNTCCQCQHHLLIYLIDNTILARKFRKSKSSSCRRRSKNYLDYVFRKQKYRTSEFPCNAYNVGCIHFLLLLCSIQSFT